MAYKQPGTSNDPGDDMPHHNTQRRRRRARAIAPATAGLITACLLAAGCGSGTATHAQSSDASSAQQLAFSKCMRTHGVPDFPDPGTQPPGGPANTYLGFAIPASIDMQSPAFQAAQHDCQGLFSEAFNANGKPTITPSMRASLIAHAQCMREHGVPGYQDPTFTAHGIGITDAGTDPQSPAYQHAQTLCGTR